jgi:hypothetical protein
MQYSEYGRIEVVSKDEGKGVWRNEKGRCTAARDLLLLRSLASAYLNKLTLRFRLLDEDLLVVPQDGLDRLALPLHVGEAARFATGNTVRASGR